jgi:uncharacterized membrane protein
MRFAGFAMRLGCALIALVLLVLPAQATQEYTLPTLFDVTGVARNDVLNVRAQPRAGAAIIGTLPRDAKRVEVVAHDSTGRWGRVNLAGQSGWVSMRFLAYRTDVWNDGALPRTLRCFGTEPFWSFVPARKGIVFSTPDRPENAIAARILSRGVFREPRRVVTGSGLTAVIVPLACSDGMSDMVFGLDVTVVRDGAMLTGCCSLAP